MTDKERIIIFTMEKVGSSSVKWALEHAGYLVDRVTPHNSIEFYTDLHHKKIISMVRDPIAWFYSLQQEYKWPPSIFDHEEFMKIKLGNHTKIDRICDYYFDKEQGWQIYDERLLIIRTESLTKHLDWALCNFLGDDDYLVEHRARGIDRFGPDYLDKIPIEAKAFLPVYNLPYMQHFYTPEEIEGFKQRWLKKS